VTGLSEVRVEPDVIANEADPTARLTVEQDLTDGLAVVYSTDLVDNDQIWVARYDLTRRFQTRAVRQSDNSYRFDLRHDVRFGGRPEPRRAARQRPKVVGVSVPADAVVSEAELRRMLDVETGEDFDYFAVRDRVEKIEAYYRDRGWLQSRVRLQREGDGKGVKLDLRITTGPRVDVQFQGATPPSDVVSDVRLQWHRGVFDTQRGEDSAEALRTWLIHERYLNAQIDYAIQDFAPDRRHVLFRIDPGTRFNTVELEFGGASNIPPRELNRIIDEQRLESQLFTDPVVVTELLERYYREHGYLAADVEPPQIQFDGLVARVVFPITEGPQFIVRQVRTRGNAVIATPTLVGGLPVEIGDPFLPSAAEQALERVRKLYWDRGYNDVRSDYELTVDRPAGAVDVTFTINEGLRAIVADIAVEGNEKTSERLVRGQLEVAPGQPLNLSALGRSRRNLYDTGGFSIVDITREDLAGAVTTTGAFTMSGPQPETAQGEKPVRLNVSVREVQPFQLRYGGSYDTERGVGVILDLSNHNSLGKARVLGISSRYDSQLLDLRGYINQPSLRSFPIATTASVYYREERNPATEVTGPFDFDRRGASIQQEKQLANSYVWSYGYRIERARPFDPRLGSALGEPVWVSPLTSTFTREGRDEVLDASRGSFLSQAFSYSPTWLGSDQTYVKYYGQYFHYFPLQAPQRRRFTNEILRPRLVYAVGVRLGLANEAPASERFFAGGSTTLRGFAQNAVGPIDANGIPTGGDAMLVVNNELRFPLVSIFDGVAFVDVGNVFARAADFSFTDLRESAGVGLRVRTRWFVLRGDYGFVLDRLPGERRSRFYFSLGQAF
jgi:outer membrane protein assembly complex protein YaeT